MTKQELLDRARWHDELNEVQTLEAKCGVTKIEETWIATEYYVELEAWAEYNGFNFEDAIRLAVKFWLEN